MKLFIPLLIVLIIGAFIYFRNTYRTNRTDSLIKRIKSKKISLEQVTSELKFIYARKEVNNSINLHLVEQKLSQLSGENIKKEKYILYSIERLNNDNILLIVGASISDFIPLGNSLIRRNYDYNKLEYYNYVLKKQDKEVILYSDMYSDLRMKLDKEEVASFLLEYISREEEIEYQCLHCDYAAPDDYEFCPKCGKDDNGRTSHFADNEKP